MRLEIRTIALAVLLLALAPGARAELAAWDQAKVTELATQLETSINGLFDSLRRQPPPTAGNPTRAPYFRLMQEVRQLRNESRFMARALRDGSTQEELVPSWNSMMVTVRRAQDNARRIFAGTDVQQHADAARAALNQLAPYFDPNAEPIEPPRR